MKKLFLFSCLLLAATYVWAAFVPTAGVLYNIVQTSSNLAVGAASTQPVVQTLATAQAFEFIPVSGLTDTYYLKNLDGNYLNNSTGNNGNTVYQATVNGTSSEWVISGTDASSIRLNVNAVGYLASTNITTGSALYCYKTVTDANGLFQLIPMTVAGIKTTAASLPVFLNLPTNADPSAEKSFTVLGGVLTADIVITAPANFELSTVSGSSFTNQLTLTQANGAVVKTIIYVRLKAGLAANTYSGNITLESSGYSTLNIALHAVVGSNSMPAVGVFYNILQISSNLVVGATSTQPLVSTASGLSSQSFEFVPISGKTNTYYIKNGGGNYLNRSTANTWDTWSTIYETTTNSTNSEWVVSTADANSIRMMLNANNGYLGSDEIVDSSFLYCDKAVDNGNGLFVLVVAPAPIITSFSPTSGSIGTLVTITGSNLSSPTKFSIGDATANVISNTGTALVGLVMSGAVTGKVSLSTISGTAISSNNFTVTPTPYPSSQQGNKLLPNDAVSLAGFGKSVSISADGNTAIIGGSGDNDGVGAVWAYIRSGKVWAQQGPKLIGTNSIGLSGQGSSVSISADGNTAIVGGSNDNSGIGATWVFTRSGETWTQQGDKLVGSGSNGVSLQGFAVSLCADGNTAIVGGFADNDGAGAAWIFTRSGGIWSQLGDKLVGSGAVNKTYQGYSVAISADGNTAIVGGQCDNTDIGAVWVYYNSAGIWSQQGNKIICTGATGVSHLGASVSLSSDGNTAMIGGDWDNGQNGATWAFTRISGVWTQQGDKLVGTGAIGSIPAQQGISVSLSSDGNTAIVGGFLDNNDDGAVWVYTRFGEIWSQQGNKLVGIEGLSAYQGCRVSISSDGTTAIVGGTNDNSGIGAAWIYTIAPSPTTVVKNTFSDVNLLSTGKSFIHAEFDGDAKVEVYNLSGLLLKQTNATNAITIENLNAGLYIIKINGMAYKVLVK